ncbi:hypothetical protein Agabi119p4_6073 [Agaricus bisporus var. burnettii]|uniref:Uncharacterized protein n=1 Tax=Agaricus bisporus var. burnettii TaxID=192524 RepID=A0A8H7F187_AGABI|nr:hypothetical protein Agabi119p4_6073 [Agaricus bisporus var. burnettii]
MYLHKSYHLVSSTILNKGSSPTTTKASKITLLIPPCTFLVVLIAEIMLVLLQHEIRETIGFNVGRIYCNASHRVLMLFMGATCLSLFCAWFYIYGTLLMLLKTHWPALATCEAWRRKLLIHSAIRITLMTVAVCIGIIVCIFAIVVPAEIEQPASAFQYLALPLAVFLLFGTQTDVLRCWTCGGSRSAKVSNA